jgi:LysM repeat protein
MGQSMTGAAYITTSSKAIPGRVTLNRTMSNRAQSNQVILSGSINKRMPAKGMPTTYAETDGVGQGELVSSKTPNRGKRLRTIVLACVLTVSLWGGWNMMVPQEAHSQPEHVAVVNYTVRPGDTLWSYAQSITGANQDVAQTVDELMALNKLDSASLQPGQNILVPAE